VWADVKRTLPQWANILGVAPNTVHNWATLEGLTTESRGKRKVTTGRALREFLIANPQLHAAAKALLHLESAERAQEAAQTKPTSGTKTTSTEEPRAELRELRARVATLSQQLDETSDELARLRASRDLWRQRARAHRTTIRNQLDVEEAADALDAE
jgi:predicted RNase H-like nuclease (RuvC/YqgF family)